MLKLQGQLIRKPRAKIPAPDDGCQRNGSNNLLKGAHAMYLNGLLIPHGQVSMYLWERPRVFIGKPDCGVKVFLSAKHGWHSKKKYVRAVRARMKKYYKKGISPKPHEIIPVKVDLKYKDKHYKKKVWGLVVDHCYFPEDWEDYCNGIPLTWCNGKYKDYSPEGFKKFKKKIDRTLSNEDKKTLKKISAGWDQIPHLGTRTKDIEITSGVLNAQIKALAEIQPHSPADSEALAEVITYAAFHE